MNSNLSVINRLKRLSKFFCKLLIFSCSIEKLLSSKLFKFREDSSGVKYCESLKLNALKKFSSGSWLSLFSIFSKSKVLNPTNSKCSFLAMDLFGNPSHNVRVWNSRVRKPSYALWRHKTELSQIVTPQLISHEFFLTRNF